MRKRLVEQNIQLQKEIAERERAEDELQKTLDELELRVEQRAEELAKANKQLKLEIEDRKQADEALRESEEKYRTLVESSSDAILMLDTERNIISCNQAFMDLFGYDRLELEDRSIRMIHLSDEKFRSFGGAAYPAIERFGSYRTEWEFIRKDGSIFPAEAVTSVIKSPNGLTERYVAIIRDITERTSLESQLRQAQKMESIGTLAGGIAHDFNNILSVINGFTELAYLNVEEGSTTKKYLTDALGGCRRAKDLVKQILAFSRQPETKKKPIDVIPIVKEALKFMRSALPSTIEINKQIAVKHGIILGDPVQIHQVLINLCTNAGHAMQDNGGILEVAVTEIEIDHDAVKIQPNIEPGFYLKISVRDTGCGMKPEILERIFDPYFTTKGQGEGTGLGLSVVHGIIKSLEGSVRVESNPGSGSTFDIFLPIIKMSPVEEVEAVGPILSGRERILCVDDEPSVLNMCKQMLNYLGYQIETKTSSLEALELFRKQSERFDLIMTDMTMPQMTGDRLAAEIMKIRPDMPVILCTGFSHKISEKKAKQHGIKAFLMKPLVLRDLASTVRKVLDQDKE